MIEEPHGGESQFLARMGKTTDLGKLVVLKRLWKKTTEAHGGFG
jgi:hypothetical protein